MKQPVRAHSRVYDSGCLGTNLIKGDLSIPDSISKYIKRWIIWVKSVYDKKTSLAGTRPIACEQ